MSGWPPVLLVGAALTTCGLGVLGLLGAARSRRELLRMAPIAPLAGMAWIGIVAATAATAGLPFGIPGLIVVTVLTCSAGAYLALRATGPARAPAVEPLRAAGRGRVAEIGLTVGGGLVLLVVCGYALAAYWFKPLVEYDGWAMWGMKAKALALLGGDADVLASPAYSRLHLEYPLLLPALHALPIEVADSFSSNLVVLSCVAVALAALLALWGILRDLARPALLLPGLADTEMLVRSSLRIDPTR